jgi:ABC-type oligopeptide transport system substrate-binding subunit
LNKKRFLLILLTSIVLLGCLSGCNFKKDFSSNRDNETLNSFYHTDPNSFDYLVNYLMSNSTYYDNFVEGLLEYDPNGNLKGAMAKSWKVSKDNRIYTYQIRKGVKWMQADGSEYDRVKPSDWVAGLKYAADSKSQMMYVANSIEGLSEYIKGEDKNFSHVGVKADDKKGTLTYMLMKPEPYWNSKLVLGIFFPVNTKFLKLKSKSFGKLAADSILYNGPYVLAEYTSKSVIRIKANDAYYDKKNVHVKNINLTFDSGKDPSQQYRGFAKGEFSSAILKPSDAAYKKIYKKNKNKICYMSEEAGTYFAMFNFNRQSYKYTTPNKDKESTHKAIMNSNFRKAILFSLNLEKINSQSLGEYAGGLSIRHSLTPPNFVSVGEKNYGTVLQKRMNALDPNWKNVNFAKDGNNTSHNVKLAKQYFAKAKEELSAKGVKFPIHLDAVENESDVTKLNVYKSFKQSIENSLSSNNVVYDVHKTSKDKMLVATYQAETSKEKDYDFACYMGWNPDYRDPISYLAMYGLEGNELKTLGLSTPTEDTYTDTDEEIIKSIGLDKYDELLSNADEIRAIDKQTDRYEALANAEAYLLNSACIIPIKHEIFPCILRIKPFSWPASPTGVGSFVNLQYPRWKYVKLQDDIVTAKEYKKAQKNFDKKFAKNKVLDEVK